MANALTLTESQLLQISQIVSRDFFTPEMIRSMYTFENGPETLRLIVRNGMNGSDKIIDALWGLL